jgi:hypothetical protein
MVGTEPASEVYKSPSVVAHPLQVHPSAVIRWMRNGTVLADGSRVYLKHIRLPGGFRTTQTWLDDFLQAVADGRAPKPNESTMPQRARVKQMRAALAAQAGL